MFRFLLGVVALVALLAGILVLAPGLIPVSAYKPQLEKAASDALGRKVTIGGDIALKIVPKTAFRADDLIVADAEGFPGPHLVRVKSADIGVRLGPLLRREVEIERFVLTEPDIRLVKLPDGRINWNLAKPDAAAPQGAAPELRDIRLGDVRLVDGKASYTDGVAAKTYVLEDIDAAVKLASLSEPLEIDGAMKFQGAPTKAKIVLTTLSQILKGEAANLKLDATLGSALAAADLSVETKDKLAFSGPLKLNAPNLPEFAKILGSPLQEGAGFDALSVEGDARGTATTLALSEAKINFDKIDAAGDLMLDWSGKRPMATGTLAAGALDLRPYLPPPLPPGAEFPAWSTERIDLASLRNIDAAINLTAQKVYLNGMSFDASKMKLAIDDGRMVADIPSLGMYGGGASGQLIVNVRGRTPTFTGAFDATRVIAERFAVEVLRNDRLLGIGAFKFQFSAEGSSQAAIMKTLDGRGGFDLADGALKGVNLVKLARAVDEIRKGGVNPMAINQAITAAQSPNEKTDFTSFLSAFTINNGQLSATTIDMKGPFITMTGGGGVNIAGQKIDLKLAPRVSSTADGKAGYALAVPLKIGGTFAKPRMSIDAESLLRSRVEKGIGDFLGGVFGGKKDPAAPGGASRSPIDDIFGGGDPAEGGEAEPAREKAVAKSVTDAIFGTRKKPAEEEAPAEPQ